jgi:anaerobic selenocysteine-containing dehydrogenase
MAERRVLQAGEDGLHYRACHLCEAMCGLQIEVKDGKIASIRGDEEDPHSGGYTCPKGHAIADLHEDPDILRKPIKRVGDSWKEISWEEALDETASAIHKTQKKYGRDALGVYFGNPATHHFGCALMLIPLVQMLDTKNRYSAASTDQLPQYLSSYLLYGHQLMFPIPDLDRTDFFLIVGGNPMVSNGSIMSTPDMRRRLKAIQERGGKVVVVDPRKTQTAEKADQHVPIYPETDVWLLSAMIKIIYDRKLTRLDRLSDFTRGLEDLLGILDDFDLEACAKNCRIPLNEIEDLATSFASANSAVAYGRLGASQQIHGSLVHYLINVLNIITGNLDNPGGAMFPVAAVDFQRLYSIMVGPGHYNEYRSRVSGAPEFGDELPVGVLKEEIETPGKGQIKAMLMVAGNPVLSTPEGDKLSKAMEGLDFCVAVDFYLNESTRHANIILPPSTALYHDQCDFIFQALATRQVIRYAGPVFKHEKDAKEDWEILLELHHRIWKKRSIGFLVAPVYRALVRALKPAGIVNLMLKIGPQGWFGKRSGISIKKLRELNKMQDLGALEPVLPKRLFTRNKKINLDHRIYLEALERLHVEQHQQSSEEGFVLIGRRHLNTNNSWMHNSPRLSRGKNRCTVQIHEEDARILGIRSGALVRVKSKFGEIQLEAELSSALCRGVVSIPHGWGHDYEGVQLSHASQKAGVSVNDITSAERRDYIVGTAAFNGQAVELEAV